VENPRRKNIKTQKWENEKFESSTEEIKSFILLAFLFVSKESSFAFFSFLGGLNSFNVYILIYHIILLSDSKKFSFSSVSLDDHRFFSCSIVIASEKVWLDLEIIRRNSLNSNKVSPTWVCVSNKPRRVGGV